MRRLIHGVTVVLTAGLGVVSSATAQGRPVKISPAIMVLSEPGRPPVALLLERVQVEVVVSGMLARTTTTMTFLSQHTRVLEGELVFPLPEGATVSGYGLDVNGEMVDAVAVDRQQARIAFEAEVRKGADPGLVEHAAGNSFRTRVWPVPAHGRRTIRVEYVSDLVSSGGAALYPLTLPDQVIGELKVRVEVVQPTSVPQVQKGNLKGFAFGRFEESFMAETTLREFRPTEEMLIALPDAARQEVIVERAPDGSHYFVIQDFPPPPPAPPIGDRPARVGIFWDASLSRAGDRSHELRVLGAWLRQWGTGDVDLVVFRNVPEPPRRFAVQAGEAAALLDYLRGVAYDGATDLGSLTFRASAKSGSPAPPAHAYDLLFTDGLSNLGGEMPRGLTAPLYVLSSDLEANHAWLQHLAAQTGGEFLDLNRLTDAEVVPRLGRPAFSLLAAEYDKTQLDQVSPAGAQPVQGRVTLTGRLLADQATLRVHYGYAVPGQVKTFTLTKAGALPGTLVACAWAQHRAGELALFPERNLAELRRLGRQFGLVTPATSLLVLETVEQYLEHGIEPPATRAAMRAEYQRRAGLKLTADRGDREAKLNAVVAMWNERVAWWEREFRYDPGLMLQQKREGDRDAARTVAAEEMEVRRDQAPRAAAPPPPAARPAGSAPVMLAPAPAMQVAAAGKSKDGDAAGRDRQAVIAVKAWDPQTPYLTAMKQAAPESAYAEYLRQRDTYRESPAFYLDCADFFFRAKRDDLAVRVLTSIVELKLEDARLLRIAGRRLELAGQLDTAILLFERVRGLRPEEPQSHRDLALALAARAEVRMAQKRRVDVTAADDFRRSLELFDAILVGHWDGRFPQVEVIALEEMNRVISVLERADALGKVAVTLDPRLRKLLDVDVRIVLGWDTDQTDMDLWVTEPNGEKCFYSHNLTAIGGIISRDFTGGYGPEEYLVKRALAGSYVIQANFYGSRSASLTGPTTVQATVITNYGRANEKREALTLRLTEAREVVDVGSIRFETAPQP